jgi:hypothetical protein
MGEIVHLLAAAGSDDVRPALGADVAARCHGQLQCPSRRHYHLGLKPLARSTLADANAPRPVAVFEALLHKMLGVLTGSLANDARNAVRLLDSTIISLSHKMHRWALTCSSCGSA